MVEKKEGKGERERHTRAHARGGKVNLSTLHASHIDHKLLEFRKYMADRGGERGGCRGGRHLFTIPSDGKAGWSCPLVIVMVIVNTALYGGHNWRCCHCQRKENVGVAVSLYCVAHLLSYADPRDGEGGGEEGGSRGCWLRLWTWRSLWELEWRWSGEGRGEWNGVILAAILGEVEIENESIGITQKM